AYRTPESVKQYLNAEEFKLYSLIWERFIACQMLPALYEVTTMDIAAGDATFRLSGRRLAFDGHARVSGLRLAKGEQELPKLEEKETLTEKAVKGDQHFTSPPPRFSEASLVKTLEKLGIGRPSTYATIISTIADRGYVRNESRRFFATELGQIVNGMVTENFSRIVDSDFTAKMESQLDKIEEGDLDWVDVMANFYELFKDELAEAEDKIEKIKGVPATDAAGEPVPCTICTKEMVVRWSKEGKFFGCADYPTCKGTLPLDADGNPIQLTAADIECPECTEAMVVRMSKRGPFLGCSTFPKCRGTRAIEALKSKEEIEAEEKYAGLVCDKCGAPMRVRISRGKPFLGCSAYPECRNAMGAAKIDDRLANGEMRIDEELREAYFKERDEQMKRQEGIAVGRETA
ncbi:MAG: topoisomerase DNA-binding C4 zinc finger domain-containing protein, partial [Planctomycetes bacterium]|nr:topoisomerase DNA-binding C4 zinc finger domain-containing protein [Planctomycetota bacterium]